jgi:hypothetical protein
MHVLIAISSCIGGLVVLFFAVVLCSLIVDRITFKRKIRMIKETGRIDWLPKYKQREL